MESTSAKTSKIDIKQLIRNFSPSAEQQAHTLYREYPSNMMFEMIVGGLSNLPAVTGPVATCSDRGQRPSFSVHLRNAF
jgi:hypothetical protein